MARQTTKPIPASFQKLDTNVTAADEYVNVRDLQVARKNHNILIARGLRRTLYARSFAETTATSSSTLWIVREGNLGDERIGSRKPILETTALIDSAVASVTCVVHGVVLGTGLDIKFTCVVDRPFGMRELSSSGSVTMSQGGSSKGSITAPVPYISEDRRNGIPLFRIALFMEPEIGANLSSGTALGAVGSSGQSVTVATASLPAGTTEGRALHFAGTGGTDIPARVCSRRADSGANSELFVSKPFGPLPVAGTNTLSIDEVATFQALSVTIYEDHLTAFDANRAGL